MARIRTVKPEIHQDEAVGELSDSAFRMFIGLITLADDYGRLKGGLGLLNSQVWPYAPKALDEVDALLTELASTGLIQRYEVDAKPYVCLPSWEHHQRIDNAGKTRIPGPDMATCRNSPRDSANDGDSPLEGKGEEGKGSRKGEETAASASVDPAIFSALERASFAHSAPSAKPESVVRYCQEFSRWATPAVAEKFAAYWADGPGAKKSLTNVAWAWRNWLERESRRGSEVVITKSPTVKDRSRYDAKVEAAS